MGILWFTGVQLSAVTGLDLNHAVDGMGYLWLSTKERYPRRIGNTLDDDFKKVAKLFIGFSEFCIIWSN